MKMKGLLLAALTAATLLATLPAQAQDAAPKKEPSAKQLAQREKMKNCNAEAKSKELKGDERKAFMKGCLSGSAAEAAPPAAASPK